METETYCMEEGEWSEHPSFLGTLHQAAPVNPGTRPISAVPGSRPPPKPGQHFGPRLQAHHHRQVPGQLQHQQICMVPCTRSAPVDPGVPEQPPKIQVQVHPCGPRHQAKASTKLGPEDSDSKPILAQMGPTDIGSRTIPENQVFRPIPVKHSTRLSLMDPGSSLTTADPISRPTPGYSSSSCTPVDWGIRLATVDPGIRPTCTLTPPQASQLPACQPLARTLVESRSLNSTSWPAQNLCTGWLIMSVPCQSQFVNINRGDYFKSMDMNTMKPGSWIMRKIWYHQRNKKKC